MTFLTKIHVYRFLFSVRVGQLKKFREGAAVEERVRGRTGDGG